MVFDLEGMHKVILVSPAPPLPAEMIACGLTEPDAAGFAASTMNLQGYIQDRETRDAEFKAIREANRPWFEFRRALIGARLEAGLTQQQLAARAGTTQAVVARLETGVAKPTVETLARLSTALSITFSIRPAEGLTVGGTLAAPVKEPAPTR